MTAKDAAEIIAQIAILITAITGLIVSLGNRKLSLANKDGLEEVKKATDGMKDQLVASAKKEGAAEEKQDEKERKDLIAAAKAEDGPQDVKITNLPTEPVPTVVAKPAK